jgi:hypothetical protein
MRYQPSAAVVVATVLMIAVWVYVVAHFVIRWW